MKEYEDKFIKFYKKFSKDADKAKEKLVTYGNELEHAYTLSKIINNTEIELEWERIWKELTIKPPFDNNHAIKSSIKNSLHGKHKKTIEKYLFFFFSEYNRIKEKRV